MTDKYDAHATAKAGETTFTLQAGDPYAAPLTDLWAACQSDNSGMLAPSFAAISHAHALELANGNPFGKVQTAKGKDRLARETAERMRQQRHIIDKPQGTKVPLNGRLLFCLTEILDYITDGGADTGEGFTGPEQEMVRRARSAILDAEDAQPDNPFKMREDYDAVAREGAVNALGGWIYAHSDMFDFDNAGMSDAVKVAQEITS